MPNIMNDGKNTVVVDRNTITVNGKEHKIPKKVKGLMGQGISQINGRIYINGWRFHPKTGKWTVSIYKFKALMWVAIAALAIFALWWALTHLNVDITIG